VARVLFHEAMAQALVDQGVRTVFGLIGDGNLFMVDSFHRLPGTTYVGMTNESTAVQAAFGYTHTSGELGVASVTHGPAMTNTITPMIEAMKARTPLVVIAGATPVVDKDNLQAVPQRELTVAGGVGFEQLRAPETLAVDLATAIARAYAEKRPVLLNVPAEFQWLEVDYVAAASRTYQPMASRPGTDALDAAVGLLASARRPLVLAGRGAIGAADRAALLKLAARVGAPVATTLKGKDLFRGEAYDLGVFGTVATPVALDAINAADVVVAFGASLNRWTTVEGSLLAGKRVVHVDIDRSSLGRFTVPTVGIVGETATTAETMVEWLDEADSAPSGFASPELAAAIAGYPGPTYTDGSTDSSVDIRTALLRVDAAFPQDRTLVHDAGRFLGSSLPLLHVADPRGFVHTINSGSIGLGVGTAIGASVGAPGRPTLLVTGDGGFMLGGLTEFSTAARLGLDLTVVVLNDGAYGAEHVQFVNRGLDPELSLFAWPELAPVADALGGQGFTARNLDELDAALAALASRDRPVLIDVKVDPHKVSGLH
jgi:thiamine pyrophosphate-dependent acetolactate synthase large subunit-like protein